MDGIRFYEANDCSFHHFDSSTKREGKCTISLSLKSVLVTTLFALSFIVIITMVAKVMMVEMMVNRKTDVIERQTLDVNAKLSLMVENSRNRKPWFNILSKNVDENTDPGFVIADISKYAIDDERDQMTYAINERGSEICTIGHRDGKLRLKISPDREKKSTYEFIITVSDDYKGGINRSTILHFYLYILDMNDNRPVFQKTPYNVTIREDASIGTEVLQLSATDIDTGRNKNIRYMFNDFLNQNKLFQIDQSTGKIILKNRLNFESQSTHILDVVAKDDGEPSLSATTTVVINVLDSGDKKPIFDFNQSDRKIMENAPIGTSIAHVHAADGDKSINNDIGYSIISGNEHGFFQLNQYSGNLTVFGYLDREQYNMFILKIKAYEIQNPESFNTVDLKIKIIDENDNKPKFSQNSYLIQIDEDRMFPRIILTDKVKAIDKDATLPNNQIRYWMKPSAYFEVLPKSGTIILRKPLKVYGNGITKFTVHATEINTKEKYTASTNVIVLVIKKPRVKTTATTIIINNSANKASISLVLLIVCSSLLYY